MPPYEVTLITRSLSKPDLFNTLKRAALTFLDNGAVIENFHSLGHKDLPYCRYSKTAGEFVYASNLFLIKSTMPLNTMHNVQNILKNDRDLLNIYCINMNLLKEKEFECNLPELMKPPAYRESVENLRKNQKLHWQNKRRYRIRAMRESKVEPKSFFIAPGRD